MSDVYLINENSEASNLTRISCKDEDKELQTLLLRNPWLLPSKQINPENPPRWLLVKREMPVPDPSSGSDRWSIDFLYVDHLAVPTLVECKRCKDTRSRREVIAQMLEYAANGQHYWSEGELERHAAETAGGSDNLARWIAENSGGGIEDFFQAVESNLRESRMRLVFFLEDSPNELRSLVDFLNKQLASTEVLLVEARLYEGPSGRIAVPWLFGYTEEARLAKRASKAELARQGTDIGKDAFLKAVDLLEAPSKAAINTLLCAFPHEPQGRAYWQWRSYATLYLPEVQLTRGLFSVMRNGDLELAFGNWKEQTLPKETSPAAIATRFADGLEAVVGITFTEQQRQNFPKMKLADWMPHCEKILALLRSIVDSSITQKS